LVDGQGGINVEANRINNEDLQDFSIQLPTLKNDQYDLFLAYNCLDLSQTQIIDELREKGLSLTYYDSQKPECSKRVQIFSTIEPIFY
jgi:hypothetical protein